MERAAWNPALDTRQPAIDEQHRELFRLHGDALEGVHGGDARAVRATLAELLEVTRRHFAFEEALMAGPDYEGREAHARDHRVFLGDLVALVAQAERDACAPGVRLWMESRYASWWKHHVRSCDAGLAQHLARRVEPPADAKEQAPSGKSA